MALIYLLHWSKLQHLAVEIPGRFSIMHWVDVMQPLKLLTAVETWKETEWIVRRSIYSVSSVCLREDSNTYRIQHKWWRWHRRCLNRSRSPRGSSSASSLHSNTSTLHLEGKKREEVKLTVQFHLNWAEIGGRSAGELTLADSQQYKESENHSLHVFTMSPLCKSLHERREGEVWEDQAPHCPSTYPHNQNVKHIPPEPTRWTVLVERWYPGFLFIHSCYEIFQCCCVFSVF